MFGFFFNSHKIVSATKYGLQTHKPTEQALTNVKENVVKHIADRAYTSGLFLHFKKAFDSAQHNILLKKLDHYGMPSIALGLIKNYLANRSES